MEVRLRGLVSCAIKESIIATTSVRTIYAARAAGGVFSVIHTIARGGRGQTLSLCCSLLALQRPPVQVLFLLTGRFHRVYLAGGVSRRNLSRARVTSGLKMPSFIIQGLTSYTESCAIRRLRGTIQSFISTRRTMGANALKSILDIRLLVIGCDSTETIET